MLKFTPIKPAHTLRLVLCLAATTTPIAQATEPTTSPEAASATPAVKPQNIDKKALAIYDKMRAAYKGLTTYSMTTLSKVAYESGKVRYARAEFSFRSPNRSASIATFDGGSSKSISNGRTFYAAYPTWPKQYAALPMPPAEVGTAGLMQYRVAGHLFTPILAGVDIFSAPWGEPPHSIRLGAPQTIANAPRSGRLGGLLAQVQCTLATGIRRQKF